MRGLRAQVTDRAFKLAIRVSDGTLCVLSGMHLALGIKIHYCAATRYLSINPQIYEMFNLYMNHSVNPVG